MGVVCVLYGRCYVSPGLSFQKLCAGCVTERDILTFLAIMPVAMLVSICPMLIVYSGYMSIQVSAQRVLSRKFEIEIY